MRVGVSALRFDSLLCDSGKEYAVEKGAIVRLCVEIFHTWSGPQ